MNKIPTAQHDHFWVTASVLGFSASALGGECGWWGRSLATDNSILLFFSPSNSPSVTGAFVGTFMMVSSGCTFVFC